MTSTLRLLSYNIRYGGAGRERELATTIQACHPDVVLLQEATHPAVVKTLARSCGMQWSGSLAGESVGFLSRIEVGEPVWHRNRIARRHYLELTLGSGLRLFGVHLSAIHSNLTEQRRIWELRALLRGIRRHQPGMHAICGDFNTLAPGEKLDLRQLPPRLRFIAWLTGGNIRWRTIKLMLEAGYLDVYRELNPDTPGFTFPTPEPHIRLDYLFLPTQQNLKALSCEVVLSAPEATRASDHFPLLTVLSSK